MPLTNRNGEPKFTIVGSFEDKEYFGSDPEGYYIEINGIKVAEYGDDYHDHGLDKCEAFIAGYCFAKGIEPPDPDDIKYEERDDFEY